MRKEIDLSLAATDSNFELIRSIELAKKIHDPTELNALIEGFIINVGPEDNA